MGDVPKAQRANGGRRARKKRQGLLCLPRREVVHGRAKKKAITCGERRGSSGPTEQGGKKKVKPGEKETGRRVSRKKKKRLTGV